MNTTRRFVVFDMNSGYIFGEACTDTPEAACSLVHYECCQEHVDFEWVCSGERANASYYVHDCTDLHGLAIEDGQDQDTIDLASKGEFIGYYKRMREEE